MMTRLTQGFFETFSVIWEVSTLSSVVPSSTEASLAIWASLTCSEAAALMPVITKTGR